MERPISTAVEVKRQVLSALCRDLMPLLCTLGSRFKWSLDLSSEDII